MLRATCRGAAAAVCLVAVGTCGGAASSGQRSRPDRAATGERVVYLDRHERDRLTTFFYRNGRQVDGTVGRITYGSKHSAWMSATPAHNCIVIDGRDETAGPARLIAHDFSSEHPVAVVATGPRAPLYEGVDQLRAIAIIEDYHVVFDRVACDRPHSIDRYQWGQGAARMSVPTVVAGTRPAGPGSVPHLPERGSFSAMEGGPCGREVTVTFGNRLAMRLVSDGDMEIFKAMSVGGYQAHPREVTFARRASAGEAVFLAGLSAGEGLRPPGLGVRAAGKERIVVEVTGERGSYVLTIEPGRGRATLARRDVSF